MCTAMLRPITIHIDDSFVSLHLVQGREGKDFAATMFVLTHPLSSSRVKESYNGMFTVVLVPSARYMSLLIPPPISCKLSAGGQVPS